jgi:sporulation protein YlmC with PRC-barrel domain
MILGDLIGLPVRDSAGRNLGKVNEVRLVASDNGPEVLADVRVFGVLVSPHGRGSSLGYERTNVRAPAVIAALGRWHHRGTFLVKWEDIGEVRADGLTLKARHRRFSPGLPE